MKKIDFSIFLIIIVSLSSLMGCAGFSKKTIEIQKNHTEHLELIDKKIQEHEQAFSDLNSSDQNLEKRIEELLQKMAHTETHYSQIHSMLNTLDSKAETENISIKNTLSEVQKNISDLEKILSVIQDEKNELQNQIVTLQSQISRITAEIEEHGKDMGEDNKKVTIEQEGKENKEQTDEKKSKGNTTTGLSVTKQEKEVLQNLLDEALALYRDENYEESLNKWEEALAIDPENLEAKLNIEIAKEKMKSLSRK